jgi:hypothetical protein
MFGKLATGVAALTMLSAIAEGGSFTGNFYPSITLNLDVCGNSGVGGCAPGGSDPTLWDVALLFTATNVNAVTTGGVLADGIDGEASGLTLSTGPFGVPSVFATVPTAELAIGWVDYLPSDGDTPSDHVVVFADAGTISPGTSWDSLFPDFSESDILQDLQDTSSEDFDTYLTGADGLLAFLSEDVSPSIMFAPDGSTVDALAFSDGTLVGGGTTNSFSVSDAPEPRQWMALGAGVGLLVLLKRRRAAARLSV